MSDRPPPPAEGETDEYVDADDRRIGVAFRRSIWIIGAVALAGLLLYLAAHRPHPAAPFTEAKVQAPAAPERAAVAAPAARFTDVTAASGIRFIHHNGAYGEKLLPETMGGGVAFVDYDNDGLPDLLFVNSADWPWHAANDKPRPTMALYHNEGCGRFRCVTPGSGLDVSFYGMGVAVGDYDNDGFADVFVSAVGGNHLFHNLGAGKFAEVTADAGVGGAATDWSSGCVWIDYDNDGKLDLFVCNYVRWS